MNLHRTPCFHRAIGLARLSGAQLPRLGIRDLARNQIRYRKLRRARTVPLNGAQILSGQASSSLIDGHQAERISEALSRLPEHYEAVLRAKYLEQQSVAAIAENRNETPKAIESLLTRARAAFRDAYQQLE